MMMRLGVRARSSKDLDVSFTGDPDKLAALLADAPNHPVGPFISAPLGDPEIVGRLSDRPEAVDLQLLGELVDDDAWPEVRRACEEVFERRAKQTWPPVVSLRDGWAEEYAKDAVESAFSVTDAEAGCQNINRMIDRIASA